MDFEKFTLTVTDNCIEIIPDTPIEDNCIYYIQISNLKDDTNKKMDQLKLTLYTAPSPCYCTIDTIRAIIDSSELDDLTIVQNIKEASKLADYYSTIKLTAAKINKKYYEQNPDAEAIEKEQFVKYSTMKNSLLKLKTQGLLTGDLKATLGEISLDSESSPEEFDSLLESLDEEMGKWKDALQGYKDFDADTTSAVKSSREFSPFIDWSYPLRRSRL